MRCLFLGLVFTIFPAGYHESNAVLRVLYYHTPGLVLPYNESCITIQWVLYYHTMGLVLLYNGSCITIQWVLYYRTMGLVLPYNGSCITIQSRFPGVQPGFSTLILPLGAASPARLMAVLFG